MTPVDDPPAPDRPPVSVLVLTQDEEVLLPRCLAALRWADEVVVLDSGSTDTTQEVARSLGARVVEQPWLGWVGQRSAAVAAARHDWVVFVDADEVVTAELATAIEEALAGDPDPRDALSFDRRSEWLGRLLPNDQRRSRIVSFVRVFHRGHSAYDASMVVHERVVVPGRAHLLDGTLIHWRQESLTEMTARSFRYAVVEAEAADRGGSTGSILRVAVLPLVRLAWLLGPRHHLGHGTAGVLHALHKASAEWVRQLELMERQARGGLPPGTVTARARAVNDAPGPPAPASSTWRIWLAVPHLVVVAVRVLRNGPTDLGPVVSTYADWTTGWLGPGKAWADRNVQRRLHPPGHEPPPFPPPSTPSSPSA